MSNSEKVAYTIKTDAEHQRKLSSLAKDYKITQGEVIEVMLDNLDVETMSEAFKRRREDKVAIRAAAKSLTDKPTIALLKKLQSLTPEQQADLLRSVQPDESQ